MKHATVLVDVEKRESEDSEQVNAGGWADGSRGYACGCSGPGSPSIV